MSFNNPDDSEFKRLYSQEVTMLFSALDCALGRERVLYCSSELTSGLNLYQALRRHGLKTASDLRKRMGDAWFRSNIWDINAEAAVEFAGKARRALPAGTIVVTPAPFSAPDWDQIQYLAFWEELLRTRTRLVWFNRNWEFSNGCALEFAVAQDQGLPTFDHAGNTLDCRTGIELLLAAILQLEPDGFDVSKLRENLARLQAGFSRSL
jgi:hypothetical protein